MSFCSKEWCIDLLKKTVARLGGGGGLSSNIVTYAPIYRGYANKTFYVDSETGEEKLVAEGKFNEDGYSFAQVNKLGKYYTYGYNEDGSIIKNKNQANVALRSTADISEYCTVSNSIFRQPETLTFISQGYLRINADMFYHYYGGNLQHTSSGVWGDTKAFWKVDATNFTKITFVASGISSAVKIGYCRKKPTANMTPSEFISFKSNSGNGTFTFDITDEDGEIWIGMENLTSSNYYLTTLTVS